nr:hypothetical protein [Deinococcus budaensis]
MTLLTALALGTAPFPAGATTAPPLTLTQQAKKADVIVRATLGTATSVQEAGVTWTVYPLTVTETIAGDPASLPQREGKPALYLLAGVDGLPELRAGQEAFWLLYSRRLDSPVVGFSQGFYPIENGRVTRPGAATPAANSPTTGTPAAATATAPATPGTAGTATAGASGAGTSGTDTAGTGTAGTPPAALGSGTTGTGTTGAATGTPAAPTGGAAGTASSPSTTPPPTAPATAPAAAVATPTPTDPDPIESDPVKFRDALRAARAAQ